MDGYTVEIGDWMHDIITGAGQVKAVFPTGEFVLEFPTGGSLTYTSEGFIGTTKRLYWENPIIVVPGKREGLTPVLRELAEVIRSDRLNRSP